jgi:hypothetical protein
MDNSDNLRPGIDYDISTCPNCGQVEHTAEELLACYDSILDPRPAPYDWQDDAENDIPVRYHDHPYFYVADRVLALLLTVVILALLWVGAGLLVWHAYKSLVWLLGAI